MSLVVDALAAKELTVRSDAEPATGRRDRRARERRAGVRAGGGECQGEKRGRLEKTSCHIELSSECQ
jgi:hypothetical protein